MRVRLKGIHRVKKTLASGEVREYHYPFRGATRSFWHSDSGIKPGSAEYLAALANVTPRGAHAKGKFREIILSFLASQDFKALSPRYQKDIRTSISHPKNGIDREFGEAPARAFDSPRIRGEVLKWRDATGGKVGDDRVRHLQRIVSWAQDRTMLAHNRLTRVKAMYKSNRSDVIWKDDEISHFVSMAKPHAARILIAATETGLRPGDLRNLSRFHIQDTPDGKRFVIKTAKRQRSAAIPITERMAQLIAETPKSQSVFLVGVGGRPFQNADSLGRVVSAERNRLGMRRELRLYDARGTAVTRLLMADASVGEIATAMGWSIEQAHQVIEHYASLHPAMTDRLGIKLAEARRRTKV